MLNITGGKAVTPEHLIIEQCFNLELSTLQLCLPKGYGITMIERGGSREVKYAISQQKRGPVRRATDESYLCRVMSSWI